MDNRSTSDAVGAQQGAVLRRLCQQGNAQLVSEMLRNNSISVDAAQADGCTGLWLAAEQGCADVVKLLCGFRADINAAKNPGSVTALYVAAQNGHAEVVEALLSAGANPNTAKATGATPLYIACQQNFASIVRLLIRSGANVSAANGQGITPLMISSFQGHAECVKILLEAGADPMQSGQGKNALDWAQANGHRRAIQNIVEAHRATIEREGQDRMYAAGHQALAAANTISNQSQSLRSHLTAAVQQQPPRMSVAANLFDESANGGGGGRDFNGSSSWYTPQYLLRQGGGGANRSVAAAGGSGGLSSFEESHMTPAAVQQYVNKKQQVVRAMTSGAAGFQSGGGMSIAMLEEERRRNEDFRKAISKSITIGSKQDEAAVFGSRSVVNPNDPTAAFKVEQEWEAHKQHLLAHEAHLRESANEVADAWMYSSQMMSQYSESVKQRRLMYNQAQIQNRQLDEQNEAGKKKNPFYYPALSEAKITTLTDYMLKGAGAQGPPPPLPSEEEEEKLHQPDKYAVDDSPSSPVAPTS